MVTIFVYGVGPIFRRHNRPKPQIFRMPDMPLCFVYAKQYNSGRFRVFLTFSFVQKKKKKKKKGVGGGGKILAKIV